MEEMKRNGLSKAFAMKTLILAGGGTALLFLFYSLIGIADVWRWAYGVRHLLTGILVLFLAQLGTGRLMTHRTWRLPLFLFFAYSAAFPLFQILANDTSRITMEYPSRYFQVGLAMGVVLYFLNRGREWFPKAGMLFTALFYGLFALLSLNIFVYAGYYYFFGAVFTVIDMLVILESNPTESREFLESLGGGRLGLLLLGYFAWLAFCIRFLQGKTEMNGGLRKWQKALAGVVLLGMLILGGNWGGRTFPSYEYKKARDYIAGVEDLQRQHRETLTHFALDASAAPLAEKLPGTVIVVIGESARRDHMKAFEPSYPAETTPWLSAQSEAEGFYLFPRTYTNYPVTLRALSMYLTNVNQYNGKAMKDTVTVTDVAKLAGYHTWWISNQEPDVSVVSLLADASENTVWIKPSTGDDMHVLNALKEIPREGNHFVVIHLYGSHAKYRARVPDDFPRISCEEHDDTVNDYDTTLCYTDTVLREIFSYAAEDLNLQAMTYCADHGEDMKYLHSGSRFTFDMARIPFFTYLSPEYRAAYPETAAALAAHREKVFTNDLMFDTVCGLLRAPNPEYGAEYDISRAEYALTPEAARTMHGEVRVTEDPKF